MTFNKLGNGTREFWKLVEEYNVFILNIVYLSTEGIFTIWRLVKCSIHYDLQPISHRCKCEAL